MALRATRNDLPARQHGKLSELPNARLADAVDLACQVKQAHWNVNGPNFIALHELFDKIHNGVEAQVGELAERVTAPGGVAHGSVAAVARAGSLPTYPLLITRGQDHPVALAKVLAANGASLRKAIGAWAKSGDEVTADLFTGMAANNGKTLRLVEAHLQADN